MVAVIENQTYLPADEKRYEVLVQKFAQVSADKYQLLVDGQKVDLPQPVIEILAQVVHAMSQGKAISVMPHDLVVSTQEAADLLGISRPTLVRMCESGKIPYKKVNRHRRLYLADVLEYRSRQRRESDEALSDMVSDSQMLGDYDADPELIEKALKEARKKAG